MLFSSDELDFTFNSTRVDYYFKSIVLYLPGFHISKAESGMVENGDAYYSEWNSAKSTLNFTFYDATKFNASISVKRANFGLIKDLS